MKNVVAFMTVLLIAGCTEKPRDVVYFSNNIEVAKQVLADCKAAKHASDEERSAAFKAVKADSRKKYGFGEVNRITNS